jgi:hypothetical protein
LRELRSIPSLIENRVNTEAIEQDELPENFSEKRAEKDGTRGDSLPLIRVMLLFTALDQTMKRACVICQIKRLWLTFGDQWPELIEGNLGVNLGAFCLNDALHLHRGIPDGHIALPGLGRGLGVKSESAPEGIAPLAGTPSRR